MTTELHQQGRLYRLRTRRAVHYKLGSLNCRRQNLGVQRQRLKYLIVKWACEVNDKGTREKKDGNEISSLSDNERIKNYSDECSFEWKLG